MKEKIIELGVPVHLKGFDYLVKSLELIDDNNICEIYEKIALENDVTSSAVERAIRYTKEQSFKNNYKFYVIFKQYFEYNKDFPTNNEFIKVLSICFK